ncbi:MAG: DNA-binding response regulator [Coprococcus sp. 43_8]|nr:MAG: DNA-binding response regulator [Coprococcus sp. 43_8]
MNILVVDDEKEIADVVELYLQNEYHVLKFYTGQEALECIEKTNVDLAILDVMLPDMLTMGADDYIPKPFNPLELVARVKAQMRRYTQYNDGKKSDSENIIDFAGLLLNKESHECIYNEQSLPLTPTEFEILWILCENRGKVISSQRLFEEVWHEEYLKNSNNTVMVHIRHLREKLSKPTGKSDLIKTVWGVGYKIEE